MRRTIAALAGCALAMSSLSARATPLTGLTPSGGVREFDGSFRHELRIDVPPGRAGMQPDIRLTYSSDAPEHGWVGYGWSLDLGTIERRGALGAVPAYDDTDEFFLDGERLVRVSTAGVAPAEFRTEHDTFHRIRFLGDAGFEVTAPNGLTRHFGSSPESREEGAFGETSRWRLMRTVDAHQNETTVSYVADPLVPTPYASPLYPSEIRYTSGNGFSAERVVRFVLARNPLSFFWGGRTSARSGRRVLSWRRLEAIETEVAGRPVHRYDFTYKVNASGTRLLLASVAHRNTEGVAVPQYRFGYEDDAQRDAPVWSTKSPTWHLPIPLSNLAARRPEFAHRWPYPSMLASSEDTRGARFADVDGDGYADLVTNTVVYVNNRSGGWTASGWTLPQPITWTRELAEMVRWAMDPRLSFHLKEFNVSYGTVLVDVNGDGRADVVHANGITGARQVYLSNGTTGWVPAPAGTFEVPEYFVRAWAGWKDKTTSVGLKLGDVNGDGLVDFVLADDGVRRTWLNTGTTWRETTKWRVPDATPTLDFAFEASTPTGWSQHSATGKNRFLNGIDLRDANGDGLDDLIVNAAPYDGEWGKPEVPVVFRNEGVWLNDGKGAFEPPSAGERPALVVPRPLDGPRGGVLADIDRDGALDFTYRVSGKATEPHAAGWLAWSNLAWPRNAPALTLPVSLYSWKYDDRLFGFPGMPPTVDMRGWYGGGTGAHVVDVDADGWLDVAYSREDASNDLADPGPGVWLHRRSGENVDALNLIVFPLGGATRIYYVPASRFDNGKADGTRTVGGARYVVGAVETDDGIALATSRSRTDYTYRGGFYDAEAREFAGFATTTISDARGVRAAHFHQERDRRGQRRREQFIAVSGAELLRETLTEHGPDVDGVPPYRVPWVRTAETLFGGGAPGRSTQTVRFFDEYGATTQTVSYGDLARAGDETLETVEYVRSDARWLTVPARRNTYAGSSTAAPLVRAETYRYDDADVPSAGDRTHVYRWLDTTGSFNLVEHRRFDTSGNLTEVTDAIGRKSRTDYDDVHRTFPVRLTDPAGHATLSSYDAGRGVLLSSVDANGQSTRREYDGHGRLLRVMGPTATASCPTESYDYALKHWLAQAPLLTVTKRSGGACTGTFEEALYDGLGREVQRRTSIPGGRSVVTTEYDSRGDVARTSVPFVDATGAEGPSSGAAAFTTYTRDAAGRVVRVTNPDGTTRITVYGADLGRTQIDAKGRARHELLDGYGRVERVVEPDGLGALATTRYQYDAAGRLTEITDALGNVTALTFDSFGRKLTARDPNLGVRRYDYDLAGQLIRETDAKGTPIRYAYDSLGRIVTKDVGDDGTVDATYYFDSTAVPNGVGRRTAMVDPSGTSVYAYSPSGATLSVSKLAGGKTYTTEWTYDEAGRATAIVFPNGRRHTVLYDVASRVRALSGAAGAIRYTPTGHVSSIDYANGTTTAVDHDPITDLPRSRRTTAGATTLGHVTYRFDAARNLDLVSDLGDPARTKVFTYDDLDRLTSEQVGTAPAESFQYDVIGNLLQKGTKALSYPTSGPASVRPHAVDSDETGPYSYDANGNLIAGAGRTIEYDGENRPARVEKDGVVVTYVYDGDGVRAKKAVTRGASTRTTLYIGDSFRVVR